MTLLTADLVDPTGYGRVIVKARQGRSQRDRRRKIRHPCAEENPRNQLRLLRFSVPSPMRIIDELSTANAHDEYYLTDMAASCEGAARRSSSSRPRRDRGSRQQHARRTCRHRRPVCASPNASALMAEGVTIFFPQTCVIDSDVEIGADTVIEPFVQLLGKTRVGADCRIGSYSVITIPNSATTSPFNPATIMDDSRSRRRRHPRPVFAPAARQRYRRRRASSAISSRPRKSAGQRLQGQPPHLPRRRRHRRRRQRRRRHHHLQLRRRNKAQNHHRRWRFCGQRHTLVAPVRIGKGAYVGAASCITDDVPADALALGRGPPDRKGRLG